MTSKTTKAPNNDTEMQVVLNKTQLFSPRAISPPANDLQLPGSPRKLESSIVGIQRQLFTN